MNNTNSNIYSNSAFSNRAVEDEKPPINNTRKVSIYTINESDDLPPDERRPSFQELGRRKSSIFSIVQSEKMVVENMAKPKPCLPINCQKVTLVISIVFCIGIIWVSMFLILGYEAYARINFQKKQTNKSIINFITPTEKLLLRANLINESVQCPDMYLYVPQSRSCKPKCGEWGSCGRIMYYIERYVLILMDIIGIVLGVFGIISWVKNYKEYQLKQFAIFITIVIAILPSLLFAALDFPGPKYLFCSNEDKEWDAVKRESPLHLHIFSGVLAFLVYSFTFWIWFTLINISLPVYFPLSPRLQSKSFYWKLLVGESVVAWGSTLLIIGVFIGSGGRFNLENVIQPPSYDTSNGGYMIAVPYYILCRMILTTFFLIFLKIRWTILNSQKYATVSAKITVLEKRFIAVGAVYILLILFRTFYTAWTAFTIKWNLQNRAYAACITLESPIIDPYNQSISDYTNTTVVSDLLPLALQARIPTCIYPCIIPLRPILLRMTWLITISITTVHNLCPTWSRTIRRKTMATLRTSTGKSSTIINN